MSSFDHAAEENVLGIEDQIQSNGGGVLLDLGCDDSR
jgi:hypothetical protein